MHVNEIMSTLSLFLSILDTISDQSQWKYNLKILEPKSEEFKFIQDFFLTSSLHVLPGFFTLDDLGICEVVETAPKKQVGKKLDNAHMLFHGSGPSGIGGILRRGFKNSEQGYFGKGVYMTECSEIAYHYSRRRNPINDDGFIFVNEVVKVGEPRVSTYKSYNELYDVDSGIEHPFTVYVRDCKYNIDCSCRVEDVKYKVDGKGRKYRDIGIEHYHLADEFVAGASLVKPRYLIYLHGNTNYRKYDDFLNFYSVL